MLVTVLTLVYNSEYLYETIDSLLLQDYSHIQYIISDDGSDNFVEEEVSEYVRARAGENIKDLVVRKNETTLGTVKNINQALKFAKGEWIIYLSADDVLASKDVIRSWVNFFEQEDVQIATAYRDVYDKELKRFYRRFPNEKEVLWLQNKKPEQLFEKIAKNNIVYGCTTAIRLSLIKEYGYYPEKYHLIEDQPMNLRVLRDGKKIGWMDKVVIKYRDNGVSSALNYNPAYRKDMDAIYRNEIAPYTKKKIARWFAYRTYHLRHLNSKWFWRQKKICERMPVLYPLLCLLHPIRICMKSRYIIEIIRRK
nr:glycosyltransferase [Eubacterium sp.]